MICGVNAIACTAYVPTPPPGTKSAPARQETRWPVTLGAAEHDAAAAETLNADPRPLWHTTVGRAVRGGLAIAEAIIVAGTADREVVVLDRATGQVLWRVHLRGTIRGGPLLDVDRLFVATEASPEGRVYALQLKNGRELWSVRVGSVAAPLALVGETLYAGTEEGVALRLDATSGKIAWHRQLSGAIRADMVPALGGIAVVTTTDTLFLLDAATGEVRRHLPLPGAVLAAPALGVKGVRLYAGTTTGHVLAVTLPELTIAWDVPTGDAVLGAPAIVRDTVFCLTRNGTLWMIPRDDPGAARSTPLGIVATAGPTPLARGVLAGGVSGEVVLVDPASGTVWWRAQLDGPIEQPVLVRDRQLVIVAGRGDIHTYR